VVSLASRERASEDEYLARERTSTSKHEYVNGEIIAMAGASPEHNLVAGNITAALGQRLRDRPSLVLPSDQRVHVRATKMRAYPDVVVVCGPPEIDAKDGMSVLNPLVLFEVLSESTEAYDRGAKFAHYQRLLTLQEYVLVSVEERRVEHYRRLEGGQWLLTVWASMDGALKLPALDAEVPLTEIFAKLELFGPPRG
jgi:Uma2 family endonuclease